MLTLVFAAALAADPQAWLDARILAGGQVDSVTPATAPLLESQLGETLFAEYPSPSTTAATPVSRSAATMAATGTN